MSIEQTPNPFAAPTARVADQQAVPSGGLRPEARRLSAGDAVGWVGEGWELFKQAPGPWIGLTIVFCVISLVMGFIPFLGLAGALLYPVFTGGIMIGCRALDAGEEFGVGHLFEGFRQHTGNLALVGVIGLVLTVGLFAIVFVAAAAGIGVNFALAGEAAASDPSPAFIGSMILLLIATVLLTIPIVMASWFAPALVALNGLSAVEAMKLSLSGCARNILPFVVFGLVLLVLTGIAMLPLGLGLLVVIPIGWGALFYAYRAIFVA